MPKKKVNYKKCYREHFGLTEADFIVDEYEWIINGVEVKANKIHHIRHGSDKFEDITNYQALKTENHDKAHKELLKRDFLWNIHKEFLINNPY